MHLQTRRTAGLHQAGRIRPSTTGAKVASWGDQVIASSEVLKKAWNERQTQATSHRNAMTAGKVGDSVSLGGAVFCFSREAILRTGVLRIILWCARWCYYGWLAVS